MLSALVNTSQLKHYRKLQQLDVKENGRERGQKWTIQTHRQHWAQDTERGKTVRTTQHKQLK
jgi:hypothetical protein